MKPIIDVALEAVHRAAIAADRERQARENADAIRAEHVNRVWEDAAVVLFMEQARWITRVFGDNRQAAEHEVNEALRLLHEATEVPHGSTGRLCYVLRDSACKELEAFICRSSKGWRQSPDGKRFLAMGEELTNAIGAVFGRPYELASTHAFMVLYRHMGAAAVIRNVNVPPVILTAEGKLLSAQRTLAAGAAANIGPWHGLDEVTAEEIEGWLA